MKSDNPLRLGRKGQAAVELNPDTGPNPASEPDEASPRQASQAARAVMHPDRDDMEWRYWRGGWGRLKE
jgi:hypothetical protein